MRGQTTSPTTTEDAPGLEGRCHALEAELEALRQARAIHEELLRAVLDGQGIAAIVDRLAALMGNPVAVADHLFHFIAGAPRGEHGDPHRRETISRGGTAREILDDPVVGAPFRRVADERRPVLFPPFPEHGMLQRRLMAPILAGDDILGYVTLLEADQPFRDFDATVLQQAALMLALELLKQRAVLETEMLLRADFLRDLFAGNYASRESISMRASLLGIDLFRPWDLLLADLDSPASLPPGGATRARGHLLDVLRRAVRVYAPGSMVVLQSESTVVLRPARNSAGAAPDGRLADALRERVRAHLARDGLTILVAIGGRCESLPDFGARYMQARRALEGARSLGWRDRTVTLDSLGMYGVLYQHGNQAELISFARRTLGPLLEYDRHHRTALVATLDAYLSENGAFRRTAARLNVHLNTLRARLQRIGEVCGVDLADARTRLNLALALEIHHMAQSRA